MADTTKGSDRSSWFSRLVPSLLRRTVSADVGTMNAQQIVWNIVVAGLAIGGGYLAIRFTSGEEEFGQSEAEAPNVLMGRRMAPIVQNPRLPGDGDVPEEDEMEGEVDGRSYDDPKGMSASVSTTLIEEEGNETAERDQYFGDARLKPSWVDDLLEKLEQVDTKLDEIRVAVDRTKLDGMGKQHLLDETDETVSKITDFYKIEEKEGTDLLKFQKVVQGARESLRVLDVKKSDECVSKTLDEGLSALRMYINMIIENPEIPRYRRIATSNQSFKNLIAPIEGHDNFLKSIGFVKKNSCYEWLDTVPTSGNITTSAEGSKDDAKKSDDTLLSPDINGLSRDNRLALLKKGFDLL